MDAIQVKQFWNGSSSGAHRHHNKKKTQKKLQLIAKGEYKQTIASQRKGKEADEYDDENDDIFFEEQADTSVGKKVNRFRFKSFQSRIKDIQIPIKTIRTKSTTNGYEASTTTTNFEEDEELGYFLTALAELDLAYFTKEYQDLRSQLQPFVSSLVSVLFHKTEIMQALANALTTTAVKPVSNLIIALARDLQEEFYIGFPQVLQSTVQIAASSDHPEVLEASFQTMAYLFKYLSKLIVPDIVQTYDIISPLISHSKSHIRFFVAQAFGFILRKVKKTQLFEQILASLFNKLWTADCTSSSIEGVAVLLAESFKELHSNFHSRASEMLSVVLDIGLLNTPESQEGAENMKHMLTYFFTMLGHHGSKETLFPLWAIVQERLSQLENPHLSDMLDLTYVWIGIRKGSRVKDHKSLIDLIGNIINSDHFEKDSAITVSSLRCFAVLLLHTDDNIVIMHAKSILDRIFLFTDPKKLPFFYKFLGDAGYSSFTRFIYPYTVKFTEAYWKKDLQTMLLLFVNMLDVEKSSVEGLVPIRVPSIKKGSRTPIVEATTDLCHMDVIPENYFYIYFGFRTRLDQSSDKVSILGDIVSVLKKLHSNIPDESAMMVCEGADEEGIVGKTRHLALCLAGSLLQFAATCLVKESIEIVKELWNLILNGLIPSASNHTILLKGVSEFTSSILSDSSLAPLLSVELMQSVFDQIKENISSTHTLVRRYSLLILKSFNQLPLKPSEDTIWKGACPIFDICSSIEELPEDVANIRQKGIFLRKLESLAAAKVIPPLYSKIIPSYCIALLSTNFAPVWPMATSALVAYAKADPNIFWNVYSTALAQYDIQDSSSQTIPEITYQGRNIEKASHVSHPTKNDTYLRGLTCTYLKQLDSSWNESMHDFKDPLRSLQRSFVENNKIVAPVIDTVNVFCLMIKVLYEIPSMAEKKASNIIPFFLRHFERDSSIHKEANDSNDEAIQVSSGTGSRSKLVEMMKLFAMFKNPTKMEQNEQLYGIYLSILSKGDTKMQELALNCVLTWPHKGLKSYSEKLKEMVQDDKFRDQLSTFDMDEVNATISADDRSGLMDVVCRLLYGKVISRRGRNSSKAGMKARRIAIFAFVASLEQEYQGYMIRLMLEPFGNVVPVNLQTAPSLDKCVQKSSETPEEMGDLRRQIGFLSVLDDMTRQLRTHLIPFLPILMTVLVSQMRATETRLVDYVDTLQGYEETQLREIRSLILKRLVQLFSLKLEFDFGMYIPHIFQIFIDPRVEKLTTENTQSVSGLLELLCTWTADVRYVTYLTAHNKSLLPNLILLLSATKVSKEVVSHVLDMVEELIRRHSENPELSIIPSTLGCHFTLLLRNIEQVLSRSFEEGEGMITKAKDAIPIRCVSILADLSEFVTEGHDASRIVDMMVPFLKKSHRAVPEETKCRILRIMKNFFGLLPILQQVHPMYTSYFSALCQLFSTLTERESRQELCLAFESLVSFGPRSPAPESFDSVADILTDLNAYSAKRLDEPDYDRRFDAFTKINQELYSTFTASQWRPILYCLVFSLHDKDEFSVRTSAAYSLQRFVSRVQIHQNDAAPQALSANMMDLDCPAIVKPLNFMDLLLHMIIPSIRKGLKSEAESVRSEFVTLLGLIVQTFPEHPQFMDMTVLLSMDEESNVFMNLYHMQMHRRIRALKRLGEALQEKRISGSNVHHFFIPVVSQFISESTKPASSSDHNLANEAITVLGVCAGCLTWSHYFALVKRYMFLVEKKHGSEKILVRTLVSIIHHFDFPIKEEASSSTKDISQLEPNKNQVMDIDNQRMSAETNEVDEDVMKGVDVLENENDNAVEEVDEEDEKEEEMNLSSIDSTAEKTAVRVYQNLTERVLPTLYRLIAIKDDETVPVRIPLSISVTSLLLKLPESSKVRQLPRLLTTMCRILSSHLQGARDSVREALSTIACMLGPAYLTFIVQEMRTALTRGYQLHVLGYTLHAIMSSIVAMESDQSIATAVEPIVSVCIEDIFGETGKEKEVQELKSKMREIKVKKSFDTIELLCKMLDYTNIPQTLIPIKELMLNTNQIAVVRDMEEYLRRMSNGLISNSKISTLGMMKFIHDLLHETLPFLQAPKDNKNSLSEKEKNIKVQLKRKDPLQQSITYYQANAHLFVEFGLSLLLVSLKKERINIKSKEDLEMLDPFITNLGKALYSAHEGVILGAVRILTILFSCPLPSLKKSQGAILKRLFQLIGKSASNDTLLTQALFRLLTLILRDCKDVEIKEKQIVLLLKLIEPDLKILERQTVTFSLIRAVLSRKVMAKEVYDLMDKIAHILITSQSANIRELCRQTYIQFLLDYPHGHKRIHNQMVMLIKNLEYVHESGRSSVMELLHQAMNKFSDEVVHEFCDIMFVSLVQALVNDDSPTCRKMAGFLISSLLKRIELNRSERLIKMCFLWMKKGVESTKDLTLARAGVQVFGFVVETFETRVDKWIPDYFVHASAIFDEAILEVQMLQSTCFADEDDDSVAVNQVHTWEICYATLNTLHKVWNASQASFADTTQKTLSHLYEQLKSLLTFPHSWVRFMAGKFLGAMFSAIDVKTQSWAGANMIQSSLGGIVSKHPLLEGGKQISQLVGSFCEQLTSNVITDEAATQVVKNLFFIGKCMLHTAHEESDHIEEYEEVSDEDIEAVDQDESEEKEKRISSGPRHPIIRLTRKLANMARVDASKRKNPILRKSVMQWFAAIAGVLPEEFVQPCLFFMISFLYRTINDTTSSGKDAEELKQLAQQVQDLLKTRFTTPVFVQVYNQVHKHVLDKRQKRRSQAAIRAIADPEAHAKRKLQRNEMKKKNRKRKIEELNKNRIRYNDPKKMKHG